MFSTICFRGAEKYPIGSPEKPENKLIMKNTMQLLLKATTMHG